MREDQNANAATVVLLVVVAVVAEEAARPDWVQRAVRSSSSSRTDILVCLLHAERRICLSRRTLFP